MKKIFLVVSVLSFSGLSFAHKGEKNCDTTIVQVDKKANEPKLREISRKHPLPSEKRAN